MGKNVIRVHHVSVLKWAYLTHTDSKSDAFWGTDVYSKSYTTFVFCTKPDSAYTYDLTVIEVGCINFN